MNYTKAEAIYIPASAVIVALLSVGIYFIFRNKGEKAKRIPLIAIVIIMLVMEIAKQTIDIVHGYRLESLPFHFSSYYIIWFAIAAFGYGRVREIGLSMSLIACFVFCIGWFVDPGAILGSAAENLWTSYRAGHGYWWHLMFLMYSGFLIALGQVNIKLQDLKWVLLLHAAVLTVSLAAAYIFGPNFAMFRHPRGDILKWVHSWAGHILYTVLIFVGILLGDVIVFFTIWFVRQKTLRRAKGLNETDKS